MQHARDRREALKQERLKEVAEAARDSGQQTLEVISLSFPGVSQALGLRQAPYKVDMNEHRVEVLCRLALAPSLRNLKSREVQRRATSLWAHSCLRRQSDHFDHVFLNSEVGALHRDNMDEALVAIESQSRVHGITWQWDETSQRTLALVKDRLKGERKTYQQVSRQVMMQTGITIESKQDHNGIVTTTTDPFLVRGFFLEGHSSDFILAGLRQAFPLKLDSLEFVREVGGNCDAYVLGFCMDRAAPNYQVAAWFWNELTKPGMPSNVLPHAELCALHGLHLAKSRPQTAKSWVTSAHTFTSFTRNFRAMNDLRTQLINLVVRHLEVRHEARPVEHKELAFQIKHALFCRRNDDYLWKTSESGEREKTSLHEDIDALCEAIDLGAGGPEDLVHWCWVSEGSVAHQEGKPLGSPCCRDRDEAIEKVVVPAVNMFVNRCWSNAAASRWTYVLPTLKRLLLGCVAKRVLPESLRCLKTTSDLSDSLIPMLEQLVAGDADDFSSKSKLRLLRVCQRFCPINSSWELAAIVVALESVDESFYEIMGHEGRKACLQDLLDSRKSIIGISQQALADLLDHWADDEEHWVLFRVSGGRFDDD